MGGSLRGLLSVLHFEAAAALQSKRFNVATSECELKTGQTPRSTRVQVPRITKSVSKQVQVS